MKVHNATLSTLLASWAAGSSQLPPGGSVGSRHPFNQGSGHISVPRSILSLIKPSLFLPLSPKFLIFKLFSFLYIYIFFSSSPPPPSLFCTTAPPSAWVQQLGDQRTTANLSIPTSRGFGCGAAIDPTSHVLYAVATTPRELLVWSDPGMYSMYSIDGRTCTRMACNFALCRMDPKY